MCQIESLVSLKSLPAINSSKKLQTGDPTHVIQGITNEIMVASNLDFIVVMDPEGIRYSHADPSYIGLPFSSHEDVKK